MPTHDVIIGLLIALPIAFIAGRYSNRIAFFHAQTEEKLTVPEFLKSRQ
ncbi:hypothetical protein URH17368_0100 [Alicyclobacillus hesperidum URH17-3-68]|uniref:Uncharacterized protein n=1 Tax=Alicyclobacillus hesperidum TaxID=89784 RepID=A0A1H2VAT6_9BACL|nr:hypothetical protein [Alicyclobacillus hesperidum]EJY57246.1 hypothetical protein URH17368_0100 [Alicyclobacillus hesperidum URH17-3-68]GLG01251.1 hypothetical protein Alches_12900 [Alicyclobacillus hesperidum subsp. aegles]GLV14675.1 hypothetical protein Heshes_23590 [Alicyclobacillus hesperidum]SDW65432.1 hypothetical protein SAMN04489725_11070 [Alicyclobacillus hesperidum]